MGKKFFLASFDIILFIIISLILDISLYNIYHFSTSLLIIIIFQIIIYFISLISYFSKYKLFYNLGVFVTFLMIIVSCYFIYDYNVKFHVISDLVFNNYDYKVYNLYVRKSTTYDEQSELINKKIGVLKDNSDNSCKRLNDYISVSCEVYDNTNAIIDGLSEGEIQGFFVDNLEESSNILMSDYRDLFHTYVMKKRINN